MKLNLATVLLVREINIIYIKILRFKCIKSVAKDKADSTQQKTKCLEESFIFLFVFLFIVGHRSIIGIAPNMSNNNNAYNLFQSDRLCLIDKL